jgi:hypothetical protein
MRQENVKNRGSLDKKDKKMKKNGKKMGVVLKKD